MEPWIPYALIAFFAFGIANFLMKIASEKIPVSLLSLIYFASAIALLAFIFVLKRPQISFPGNTLLLVIVAGLFMGIGILAALTSLGLGQGSKAVTVFNMNTLVTVALLVLILGEKITPKVLLGIVFAVVSLYLLTA